MKSIRILGDDKEILSVELKDILKCLANGDQFKWSILWLEATGEIGKSMPEFEKEIQKSKNGLMIEWKDLIDLAKKIHQTIEIVLIGDKDISKMTRYPDDENMYSMVDYTIELIDSSYWVIHSRDAQLLDTFNGLKGVETVNQ